MDVYKVAVALSMTSNAPAFLSALSSKLLHVHTQVKDLEGGLNRLNRIKLAVGGGLAIAGGTAALAVVGKMVDKGNELVKIQQNMAAAGVKATEVQEAYAEAWRLTGKYSNVTAADALKTISEARMTFGSQEAATHHAEDFVKMTSFLKAYQGGAHGKGATNFEAEAIAAMKSGEIAGKIDPKDMAEHVKQLTAMRVAYGDQLKIGQYLTAQRAGGVALRNVNDDFRYGVFPALVQENGPNAGVMIMTAFNKLVAGTGNKLEALSAMSSLGLLDESKVSHHPVSGKVTRVEMGAVRGDKEFAVNPGEWVEKYLKPALDRKTSSPIEQAQWVSKILPDRNAAKAVTEMLQQWPKLIKDAQLMLQARKALNEGSYLDKSWEGQKQAFHEQWENFVQALGAPMVGQATATLKRLNETLSGMAQWAAKPEMAGTVEAIGKGIAVLGLALTGGGAVALLAALGPAGWIAVGLVGATAAFVAFKDPFDNWVKRVTGMGPQLDAADQAFNKAAVAFGEWVKSIIPSAETLKTGAEALAVEIKSWPGKLTAAIAEMGAGLVTAIGDMLKSLFSKLNPFSKTAFEGGEGLGGLIQKASFGGGANDNFGGTSGVARALGGGTALGSVGADGDYNAVVGGKSYRAAYAAGGKERVASWLNMLRRPVSEGGLGMNADKARAMVAMMQGESGINLNPGAIGAAGEHGTAQWLGPRRAALHALAARMGLPWTDVRVQQQMFRGEMLGGYKRVYDAIQAAPTGDHALAIGIDRFESPAKKALAYKFRHPYLQGLRRSGAGENPATEAPTAGPPPRAKENRPIMVDLHMDGRKMGRAIAMHQANDHLFPKAAGGMDTHGGWRAPGTPVTDAA